MNDLALLPDTSGPLRLLLVEESAGTSAPLVTLLRRALPDAVVSVATSLATALPLLAGPLDLALTDLSLPDAQGLEVLTALFAARPDLGVVVLTERHDEELALQALAAGAEDYLVREAHGLANAVLHAVHRRRAEQKARAYERVALSLLDAMESSTCAVDSSGHVVAVNRAWQEFADANGGDPDLTGVGTDYLAVCKTAVHPDDALPSTVASGLRDVLDGRLDRFEHEYPCHAPDQQRWFSVRVHPLSDAGAVVSHVDVTAARQARDAIEHLRLHDPLTDLPNRALLHDRLRQALGMSGREDSSVVVASLDLDHFTRINDSLGHAAGDQLLRQVAARLSSGLCAGDTLARFSGDAFVAVLPRLDAQEQADPATEKLASCFVEPFVLDAATVAVTASIGVVRGRAPQTADDLLLAAHAAMDDAKAKGRGRTRVYSDELRAGARERLRTEADLRRALERGELVLHYQPVVDLRRNVVVGVEALVRWAHPDGLRMPDTFIPVAEATGLIVPVGAAVLQEACRQGAAWAAQGLDLQMAVNFSARQISHPDVIGEIERALRLSGLRPDRLLAEVTETTVMEDADRAEVTLRQIAALGVGVAIDDFGTGYSSLLYLKRYPIGSLKVDRSFVAGMGARSDDDAIVASVVSLARAVGAESIAEGVETPQQLTALRTLGCEFAQGYLFSRPVPAADLPAALAGCVAVLARPQALPLPPPRAFERQRPLEIPVPVLRRVRELHREGVSLTTIAAALNAENYPHPHGRRWHSKSVANVVAALPVEVLDTA